VIPCGNGWPYVIDFAQNFFKCYIFSVTQLNKIGTEESQDFTLARNCTDVRAGFAIVQAYERMAYISLQYAVIHYLDIFFW
jgi:hypothetical protein